MDIVHCKLSNCQSSVQKVQCLCIARNREGWHDWQGGRVLGWSLAALNARDWEKTLQQILMTATNCTPQKRDPLDEIPKTEKEWLRWLRDKDAKWKSWEAGEIFGSAFKFERMTKDYRLGLTGSQSVSPSCRALQIATARVIRVFRDVPVCN